MRLYVRTVIPTAANLLICFPITKQRVKSPVPGGRFAGRPARRAIVCQSQKSRSTMSDTFGVKKFPRDTFAPRG